MNERIAELYRQAHLGTKDENGNTPQYFSAEKFAKSIVLECANICRDRKMAPSAFTADELLEHFEIQ